MIQFLKSAVVLKLQINMKTKESLFFFFFFLLSILFEVCLRARERVCVREQTNLHSDLAEIIWEVVVEFVHQEKVLH